MRHSVILIAALVLAGIVPLSLVGPQRAGATSRTADQVSDAVKELSPSSIQKAAYDNQAYQIQSLLNELGYDAGHADGLIGARTREAIRSYQRDQGLFITGEPGARLLEHLRDTSAERQERERQETLQKLEAQKAQESSEVSADRGLVLDVQSGLRRLGYDVPVVTGRMDNSTEAAIRSYQNDEKLLVDGRVSEQLLDHIQSRQDVLQVSSDRQTVMEVQERLNARGYDAGPADGVMGETTRNAIRTFQTDANLGVTGRVTKDLLVALGIADEEEAPVNPNGAATAAETAEVQDEVMQPEYRLALSDDFADGNYASAPRWSVLAGTFTVNDGLLTSDVEKVAKASDDVGKELLKGVLGATLGVSLDGPSDQAGIHASAWIGNAFRIQIALSGSGDQESGFSFGPYQGASIAHGYRLESNAAVLRPLRLLVVSSSGPSVIASTNLGVDLQDGQFHTLLWERSADGHMKVSVDDRLVMEANDETYQSGFDGFSLINSGGKWSVDWVTVEVEN